MSGIALDIADLTTNEKKLLKGFKVLGVFPFYLKYITVKTHLRLCAIKEQLQSIEGTTEDLNDFTSSKIQAKALPLIIDYCVTALINNRIGAFFLRCILKRKLNKSSHYHLLNLFITIHKLNEPAFFLTYWRLIHQKTSTLLKAAEQ